MKIQIVILAAVLLAGCSRETVPADAARGNAPSAPAAGIAPAADITPAAAVAMSAPAGAQASPEASVAVEAKGVGTITAIDVAAGKVTIDHGPIKSLHWPAMTMGFDASPTLLGSLKQGDKVHFEFTQQGRSGTITEIASGN